MAGDLSKQRALYADPKAIQQINFTGNLCGTNNRLMFFIFEEAKETFRFLTRNGESIVIVIV